MNIRKVTIDAGAETPFRVLHISDSHLCFADQRDCERKRTLAAQRGAAFTEGHPERLEQQLTELLAYAKNEGIRVVSTGDIIDFVSVQNLEKAKELLPADTFMAVGNHEYSQYVGEAWEDEDYKKQSFDDVMAAMPGYCWFQTEVIHGVKLIAMDNGYYYTTPELFRRFREAVADGLPCVLLVHNPLYSPDTYAKVMAGKGKNVPPYLNGCPEELLRELDDHRYRQQAPDALTAEFLVFCESLPNLKGILAGHLHEYCAAEMKSGIPQIIAGAGYHGEAVEVEFI